MATSSAWCSTPDDADGPRDALLCQDQLMVHQAAESGYDKQSDVYASVRPSYHPAMVSRVVNSYGAGCVVDLGAGTGIFTRQLVAAGVTPIAIEPVGAMRETLEHHHPELTVLDRTAEDTGLETDSVDTVVVAQAFHWFDHARAMIEIQRILKPGGHLLCVWNVRDESVDWVRRWTEIVDRHAGDAPRYRTMAWRRAIEQHEGFGFIEEWTVPNPIPATPTSVVGRALSTSFIAALDADTQAAVLDEIRIVAASAGDEFAFPYRSEFQAWRLGT